jgi:hypothetical protein
LSNGATSYPERPKVEVVTDANDTIVSIVFTLLDENFFPTVQYYCMRGACNGVTLGPVTVNTDLDPSLPLLIRRVTFDNTTFTGLNPDGTPTNTSATLKSSCTTVYFTSPDIEQRFPELMDCTPGVDAVRIEVPSGPFNFCTDAAMRSTFQVPDSEQIDLLMRDELSGNTLSVRILDGAVASIVYNSPVSQQYRCDANCIGVTVSAADANGERTVTFTGKVLYESQSFPVPGERTVTLNGGPLAFPPLLP